jgi:hypothetical protein
MTIYQWIAVGPYGRGTTPSFFFRDGQLWNSAGAYLESGNDTVRLFFADGHHARHWGCHGDVESGRLLPDGNLDQVDHLFNREVRAIEPRIRALAVLLTDQPARSIATNCYNHYDPLAHLVIALSTAEKQASVCATTHLWKHWGADFRPLQDRATALLKRDLVGDALLNSVSESCELFQRIRANWFDPPHYSELLEPRPSGGFRLRRHGSS